MKALLKKLRKYEIQIRKAINSNMQGDFRSVFKGTGLELTMFAPTNMEMTFGPLTGTFQPKGTELL